MNRAFWQAVVDGGYEPPPAYSVAALTVELLSYLGSTDPELRDVFAYPILADWLRRGLFSPDDLRAMTAQLARNLTAGLGEQGTDGVFLRAFSALMLAEIVYEDNQRGFFAPAEVRRVFEQALAYVSAERDLRGYVPGPGWAHAVAHGADLLWVLSASPHLEAGDLQRILDLIAAKAVPPVAHVYLYNEDQRLVRAVLGVLRRDLLPIEALAAWLDRLTHVAGRTVGVDAFFVDNPPLVAAASYVCLLQNTKQFLRGLYFHLAFDPEPPAIAEDLLPLVVTALAPINDY